MVRECPLFNIYCHGNFVVFVVTSDGSGPKKMGPGLALKVGLRPGPGLSPSLKAGLRAGPGLGPLPT